MSSFLAALGSGHPLLMDGAMGTELQRAGLPANACHEAWSLTRPEIVQSIHRSYLDAGARCLVTNTFQSNPVALARFGLQDELESINLHAIQLAREAGQDGHLVLASIGPMHVAGDPKSFERVIRSLASADALLLETWSDGFEEAVNCALDPAVNPRRLPVLLSLTFWRPPGHQEAPQLHGSGRSARQVAAMVGKSGLAALGVNCGRDISPEQVVGILTEYRKATALPLICRLNAGTPVRQHDGWSYPLSAGELAGHLPALLAAGASMIGGCCGTAPEHIQALHQRLGELAWARSGD